MIFSEIDPYAAQWLRNLFPGPAVVVGDIKQLHPDLLRTHERVHLFAGVGGWEYALRLAGWPPARPVWTGSCPCQPFSKAGKREGEADPRHLWPEFRRLIAECRPPTIFGEQVASADGREWLAGVRADLEVLGYAVGAADLAAASVGAPHIRQRLYWVGNAVESRLEGFGAGIRVEPEHGGRWRPAPEAGDAGGVAHASGNRWRQECPKRTGGAPRSGAPWPAERPWDDFSVIPFLDGKTRRIEPGSFPLAHGVSARVGRLRAYGNAIVPQVAATFIKAFLDAEADLHS